MPRKEVYNKYKRTVNMTYTEFFNWSKTNASKFASLDRSPITRNLRLLRKPFKKWTLRDEIDAKKTIAFIARMKEVPNGKTHYKGLSKKSIALRNWAYNDSK